MAAKVAELQKILPSGIVLKPYYVQADFVHEAVKSVSESVWIGLLLAIFVSVIFLRSVKASATILITIPITICLTLICLYQHRIHVKYHDPGCDRRFHRAYHR